MKEVYRPYGEDGYPNEYGFAWGVRDFSDRESIKAFLRDRAADFLPPGSKYEIRLCRKRDGEFKVAWYHTILFNKMPEKDNWDNLDFSKGYAVAGMYKA